MNRQTYRHLVTRAYIRKLLITPILVIRMAMLKLALATGAVEGLKVEAIPAYHMSMPLANQFHICLRSSHGRVCLTADVRAEKADYQGLDAYRISIMRARFPDHAIYTPWIQPDKAAP